MHSNCYSQFSIYGKLDTKNQFSHGQYYNSKTFGNNILISFYNLLYSKGVTEVACPMMTITVLLLRYMSNPFYLKHKTKDYIELRVQNQIQFYKKRIPKYYQSRFYLFYWLICMNITIFKRTVFEVLLILGTLTSALLALVDLSTWSAIATSSIAGDIGFLVWWLSYYYYYYYYY